MRTEKFAFEYGRDIRIPFLMSKNMDELVKLRESMDVLHEAAVKREDIRENVCPVLKKNFNLSEEISITTPKYLGWYKSVLAKCYALYAESPAGIEKALNIILHAKKGELFSLEDVLKITLLASVFYEDSPDSYKEKVIRLLVELAENNSDIAKAELEKLSKIK